MVCLLIETKVVLLIAIELLILHNIQLCWWGGEGVGRGGEGVGRGWGGGGVCVHALLRGCSTYT